MACHGRIAPRGLHMKLPKPPRSVQILGVQPFTKLTRWVRHDVWRFSSFLWDLGIQELRAWQIRKVRMVNSVYRRQFKYLGIQVSSDSTTRHTRPNVFRIFAAEKVKSHNYVKSETFTSPGGRIKPWQTWEVDITWAEVGGKQSKPQT